MPISTASAPAAGVRPARRRASRHRGRPSCTARTACGPSARAARRVASSGGRCVVTRGRSIICATSLSPRPDRFTSTVAPCIAGAARSDPRDGVRGFERRDDALRVRRELERLDDLGIGDGLVRAPGRSSRGASARARRPGSRARRRSTRPRAPARARPASGSDFMPCTTPGTPRPIGRAAGWLDADEDRAAVSTKPEKMPAAFDPPPTHATTTSGSPPPSSSRHCAAASSPMTRWNSRTIHGYGCGPITEPRQ